MEQQGNVAWLVACLLKEQKVRGLITITTSIFVQEYDLSAVIWSFDHLLI
jgi:hypothetical protein